ncbi:MAG TPA: C_GCAxxG_C_C family protein [Candidatus Fimenecus excrementigallinarum]|uniref:C_GCAxxG_C_C family protein n=1 Tax=Candidatus Fimenecus excrementigallinarum TaxID=2840816 RepID=A0A9D1LDS4_9FIRM|nr:C_GCAxxG_C_C family protein [Candidatus Fimenecus excrementigallinarum]
MSQYTERAVELFMSGYNCAQSVFAAFHDRVGLPMELALRVSAGLGGGVGRLREVCGALCGAAMLAGMLYGATQGEDQAAKAYTYQKVQEIAAEFRKSNPSILCRELLGLPADAPIVAQPEARTESYYQDRPCPRIIESAARAAEIILFPEEKV